MSIPKEPRQLMINIMYLVLLALLALNVSAKIFKAFEKMDHSLERSNLDLQATNSTLPDAIRKGAKKDENFDKYAERLDPLRQTTNGFIKFVTDVENNVIDKAGNQDGSVSDEGDYIIKSGQKELIGKKDKDVTTRILVGDVIDDKDGDGDKLKDMILKTRDEYLQYIDESDRAEFSKTLPLTIQDDIDAVAQDEEYKTWAQYTFFKMPLGATIPMFEKWRNDAYSTESAILNYLAKKVGTDSTVVLSEFQVVSSPEKTYVIQGEKFSTDIFLSASAGETSRAGLSINVNGSSIPVENGVGKFTAGANSPGVKKYSATITVTNPVTGTSESYNRDFEYEVGLRSVAVSADKMNVFYIGVENPITVSAAGVPTASLKVSSSGSGGLSLSKKGKSSYVAKVSKPTGANDFAYVVVSGEGLKATRFPFRAKRIPDPTAKLGGQHDGGNIGNGTFKAQRGVIALLEDFDFDARCDISGFQLTRQSRNSDPIDVTNGGGSYGSDAKRLVNQAKPGDTYYFDNVRAKCPGDIITRKINQMVFKIK